jgi:hypothetical protein
VPGRPIIRASWASNGLFALSGLPLVAGVDDTTIAVVVALLLFAASLVVWVWAFGVAAARSARGDDIAIGSLFLMEGKVSRPVRRQLYGSVALCLALTALTASANPFGVLVPMLPIGLIGLWGARHGEYPARSQRARGTAGGRTGE